MGAITGARAIAPWRRVLQIQLASQGVETILDIALLVAPETAAALTHLTIILADVVQGSQRIVSVAAREGAQVKTWREKASKSADKVGM